MEVTRSGYVICGCGGCSDTTVADDEAVPELCSDCEEAECECGGECQREDAYGSDWEAT